MPISTARQTLSSIESQGVVSPDQSGVPLVTSFYFWSRADQIPAEIYRTHQFPTFCICNGIPHLKSVLVPKHGWTNNVTLRGEHHSCAHASDKTVMDADLGSKDGLQKKRPLKGLRRACWECEAVFSLDAVFGQDRSNFCKGKRRKIDGSMVDGDVQSLGGATLASVEDDSPCTTHIRERLSKLEQLFERFVCRKLSNPDVSPDVQARPTRLEKEKLKQFDFGLPSIASDPQSLSPFSEGKVTWPTEIGNTATRLQHPLWNSKPAVRTRTSSDKPRTPAGRDSIRQSLVALLPSQHDASIIFETTNAWMILQTMYKPAKDLFVDHDPQSYALDMAAVAHAHTVVIARTILHLAICISSLPPEFDVCRLCDIWSLDATVESFVSAVTTLVVPHDEIISTLPGLETLLLLSMYHSNCGNLRKSWLVIRRAINLATLMGFHRIITKPATSPPIEAIEAAKSLWCAFVDAETFIGLHLRLPFAADEYPCPEYAEHHRLHRAKLIALSRQIAELDRKVSPQNYVQALALDEKLEILMKQMSKEFWDVPNVPSTARSPESSCVLERLVGQIWHFELKIFVHLPYLLRAHKESRYEYSKITALQSSRNVILRWFALRNASITQACCRSAEYGVFIATVTLGLDILIEMGTKEMSEVQRTRGNDFAMACRVITEMEKLARASPREKIAARSALVIKKLLSSLDPNRRTAAKARLTVPYFGTIDLNYHKPPVKPAFELDSVNGKQQQPQSTATDGHLPVFSFVSNELWPSSDEEFDGWSGEADLDIILFDGMQDRDTEGNWMF
jgi:hypothetical protein